MNELLNNIEKIHTTDLGLIRLRNNLKRNDIDIVEYVKKALLEYKQNNNFDSHILYRKGKNYYFIYDNYIFTINGYSYTIITGKCI